VFLVARQLVLHLGDLDVVAHILVVDSFQRLSVGIVLRMLLRFSKLSICMEASLPA
jgi:hypothetical protein